MISGLCEICDEAIEVLETYENCISCGQDYHVPCIETVLDEKNECPWCKSVFFEGERS